MSLQAIFNLWFFFKQWKPIYNMFSINKEMLQCDVLSDFLLVPDIDFCPHIAPAFLQIFSFLLYNSSC